MKRRVEKLYLMAVAAVSALTASAQKLDYVDYTKLPDYVPYEQRVRTFAMPEEMSARTRGTGTVAGRPDHWNNGTSPYFPLIFNQAGPSCTAASMIGYMFSHEINSFRRADPSLDENIYPTHFAWLLYGQNSSIDQIARYNGIPNSVTYGGKRYSLLFGEQDWKDHDAGWMQGYEKWYSAMFNRIEKRENAVLSLQTEMGRETLKNWIWNHFGDDDFGAGGVASFDAAITGWVSARIPATTNNNANGVTGMTYLEAWGPAVDHQMTIVGYDDRIEFDLDKNGIYGEADKDELGAWIIANSWGNWGNKGFFYCPYACAYQYTHKDDGKPRNPLYYHIYRLNKDPRPLRTIKLKMDFSRRSEIKLSVGASANLDATEPDKTVPVHHFINAGAGLGNTEDYDTPMLGRWKDGLHYEPMEFGYDISELTRKFDYNEPLKYFFIIESKATATGTGRVYECAGINYEFDESGLAYPAEISAEGVEIKNKGGRTVIPFTMAGEKLGVPRNLFLADGKLNWAAPLPCAHDVKSYNIYAGETKIATVPASQTTYAVSGDNQTYTASAVYEFYGSTRESQRSKAASVPAEVPGGENQYLTLTKNTITVDNLITKHLNEFTIDFMYKPQTSAATVIIGDENFNVTIYSSGKISAGWDENNRIVSAASPLAGTAWKHVAVTVKNNVVNCYVNGISYASFTSDNKSGIDASSQFILGQTGGLMDAVIDELRFWSVACPVSQIALLSAGQMAQPGLYTGLMAYYRMDENTENKALLTDCVGGHTATIAKTGVLDVRFTERPVFTKEKVVADFTLSEEPYYTGAQIDVKNISSVSSKSFIWNAPEAGISNAYMLEPTLIYNQPGTYKVSLTVVDKNDVSHVVEKTVTVTDGVAPVADFEMSANNIACGDEVVFINKSPLREGYTYTWSMPGAAVETAKTFNTKATYTAAGHHPVTLTVRYGNAENTCVKYVDVEPKAPIADMRVTPAQLMAGEKVNLLDRSKYDPTKWTWTVDNGVRFYSIDGQSTTMTMDHPGKYNVTLKVTNALGEDVMTRKEEFTVYNADSENGLVFDGSDDEVAVDNLFNNETLDAFTIDWWMRPNNLKNYVCRMGDKNETFVMKTSKTGQMSVTMGSVTARSATGYVVENEWHHYAVVYKAGSLTFYRDGLPVSNVTTLPAACPAWTGGFHMGGTEVPMSASVDELRIWKSALTDEQVLTYSSAPIADVDAARTGETALTLYYTFNQSSGDVADASGNGYTGKRVNFGPDGDAWGMTTGMIFWIDVEAKDADVTSMYLKNYKAPFLYDEDSYINGTERYRTLAQGTEESPWQIANSLYNAETNVRTEFHVDANKDNCLALSTNDGFATAIKDQALWQPVDLPAGAYEFAVAPHAENEFFATGSYLVASYADGLPVTENLSQAIASADARERSVTFVLPEPTTVSLGLLMNVSGLRRLFTVNEFVLKSKPFEALQANGAVKVDQTEAGQSVTLSAKGGDGQIVIKTVSPSKVIVSTVDGKVIFRGMVNGEKTISLSSGLYIVNNRKVVVR